MNPTVLAHITPFEVPTGLLLFVAGTVLGYLAAQAIALVRNR